LTDASTEAKLDGREHRGRDCRAQARRQSLAGASKEAELCWREHGSRAWRARARKQSLEGASTEAELGGREHGGRAWREARQSTARGDAEHSGAPREARQSSAEHVRQGRALRLRAGAGATTKLGA
jgi:hypothetical protein